MSLQSYFVQRQPQQDCDDSSTSDTEHEPEVPVEHLSVTPNKVGLIKEMFPQRSSDEVVVLLSLLNGSMNKVISICLKGLTTSMILRVFKSSRMQTRVNKVFINPNNILRDALCLHKSPLTLTNLQR